MTGAPQLRVSAIVMTVDRPASLRRCLAALASQTLDRHSYEVVIVDGSRAPARRVVSDFLDRLTLVHHVGRNGGVSRNQNTGVALARGRIVAFVDDDCVAGSQWLERITVAVEQNPGSIVGGRVENADPANTVAVAAQVITEGVDAFFNRPDAGPRFVPGLNFALERQRYLALGGCDPVFRGVAAEDRDLVDRWRLRGGEIVVCPGAVVRHEHRTSLAAFVRQHVSYGRGAWRYHSLRRRRGSGRMRDDVTLHLALHRYLGPSLMRLDPRMRARILPLLVAWQAANLAGFVWQAALDTARGLSPR